MRYSRKQRKIELLIQQTYILFLFDMEIEIKYLSHYYFQNCLIQFKLIKKKLKTSILQVFKLIIVLSLIIARTIKEKIIASLLMSEIFKS